MARTADGAAKHYADSHAAGGGQGGGGSCNGRCISSSDADCRGYSDVVAVAAGAPV
jgi:hypothetical protein